MERIESSHLPIPQLLPVVNLTQLCPLSKLGRWSIWWMRWEILTQISPAFAHTGLWGMFLCLVLWHFITRADLYHHITVKMKKSTLMTKGPLHAAPFIVLPCFPQTLLIPLIWSPFCTNCNSWYSSKWEWELQIARHWPSTFLCSEELGSYLRSPSNK